jgi:hypothetical protein
VFWALAAEVDRPGRAGAATVVRAGRSDSLLLFYTPEVISSRTFRGSAESNAGAKPDSEELQSADEGL